MKYNVLFILSSNYSGSSLLDAILGNTPISLSCGEIQNLWRFSYHQLNIPPNGICNCHGPDCELWNKLSNKITPKNIYNFLYQHTKKRIIIDSSKKFDWFQQQSSGIEYSNCSSIILIRDLKEVIGSRFGRGKPKDPIKYIRQKFKLWVDYYTQCINYTSNHNIKNYFANYEDIMKDPTGSIKNICNYFNIPFKKGILDYWNNTHNHQCFGNSRVKYFLSGSKEEQPDKFLENSIYKNNFRKIIYKPGKYDILFTEKEYQYIQNLKLNTEFLRIMEYFQNEK